MTIPVFVQLGAVPDAIWQITDASERADALWGIGIIEKPMLPPALIEVYRSWHGRYFKPFWLFDGLNEVADGVADGQFYQKLACLPGFKVLSTRSLPSESISQIPEEHKSTPYEILDLTSVDQQDFLRELLGEGRAKKVFEDISQNRRLQELAGNPMMLTLMSEIAGADSDDNNRVPASRSELYRSAIDLIWRTNSGMLVGSDFDLARDEYLTQLAVCDKAETNPADDTLKRGLQISGLIRLDRIPSKPEFAHPAFHAYYVALSLARGGLKEALENHWNDAFYEETLGLAVSILFLETRVREIEEGIRWLIEYGQRTHSMDRKKLWGLGRSPLRTACHILARSAVPLQHESSRGLWTFLQDCIFKVPSPQRRLAASMDPFMPSAVLEELARDKDSKTRKFLAQNPGTPPEVLAEILDENAEGVRKALARNLGAPPSLLTQLACDIDVYVRKGVAGNTSTPPNLLADLGRDPSLRGTVAANPSTPYGLLLKMAHDEDYSVRECLARNPNAPGGFLIRAQDGDWMMRMATASNVGLSQTSLAKMAVDEDVNVRQAVAANESVPTDLLVTLAHDKEYLVCLNAAENRNAPPELLIDLARDGDSGMRWAIAGNPNAPPALLSELLQGEDADVHRAAIENPRTLLEDL